MRPFRIAVWAVFGCLGTTNSYAVLVSDFEPASGFTAGSTIGGVGHWQVLAGNGLTTPAGLYTSVLEGAQSAALAGSTVWATRTFADVPTMTDGTTLSWHLSVKGNQGSADTYLSHDLPGLKTPVGVIAPIGGNFSLSGGSIIDPGTTVPVLTNREYLMEMTLDFFAGNAMCYVTDLDTPGPRNFIGQVTYSTLLTAATVQSTGGLFLISNLKDSEGDVGAAAATYDNFVVLPPGGAPQWSAVASGDWNNPGNWTGGVPDAVDASANFLGSITAPQTVFTNSAVTVGSISFDNSNRYVLAGAGTLNVDVSTGAGSINVVSGSHKINLPVNFADSTVVAVAATSSLLISDPTVLAGGTTLTKNGLGTLVFQSTLNAPAPAVIKINGGVVTLDAANSDPDISINVDPATLNLGANQVLGGLTLSLGGNVLNVGRDSSGAVAPARLTTSSLVVTGGGSNTISQTLAGNTVKVNGVLQLDSGSKLIKQGAGVLSAASINLAATAQLDVTNGKVIVDYSGASPLSSVVALITSGRAGGAWNGNGINSSTAAATANRALGYVDTSVTGSQAFGAENADSSAILIAYTVVGDANLDGVVNSQDFSALVSGYGTSANGRWFKGDFDYDGKVNTIDFNYLAGNFGVAVPAPSLGSVVPEPSLVSILVPALGILRRHRRN